MPTRAKQNANGTKPLSLAWAAGFMDGEGYIGVIQIRHKNGRLYYRAQIDVSQIHREPIQIFQDMFGGVIQFRRNAHRNVWTWRAHGAKALEVARVVLPYLIVKRQQAELLLEFETTGAHRGYQGRYSPMPTDIQTQRRALWAALCELNGGRALQAERLSEKAPTAKAEGDAIVRPHGNDNRESQQEIADRLVQ